jgi:hypothetical protein
VRASAWTEPALLLEMTPALLLEMTPVQLLLAQLTHFRLSSISTPCVRLLQLLVGDAPAVCDAPVPHADAQALRWLTSGFIAVTNESTALSSAGTEAIELMTPGRKLLTGRSQQCDQL